MKKFSKYIFTLAALALATTACLKEEEYQKGAADVEGCYGVYFPTQEAAGSHTYDPSQATEVEFTAVRLNSEGDITVPVNYTESHEGIFQLGELVFADGQTEAKLKVTFPDSENGITYKLSLSIDDPLYASQYNDGATDLDFSVLRVEWKYFLNPQTNEPAQFTFTQTWWEEVHTGKVKYYEVNGVRTCVTETDPYTYSDGVGYGFWGTGSAPGEMEFNFTWYPKSKLDEAETKDAVTRPLEWFYNHSSLGQIYNLDAYGLDYYFLGTTEDDALTYALKNPTTANYYNNGTFAFYTTYNVNAAGSGWSIFAYDVILEAEGFIRTDYTLTLDAGQSQLGHLPVEFNAGADVASVKYAAFEGALYATQVTKNVEGIVDGTIESKTVTAAELEAASNVLNVSFEETGVYTVVAVTYDAEGKAQSSAYVSFSYVAANDEVPVVLTVGLGSADKYVPAGVSTDTALEFWAYGKDLESVKFGFFTAVDLEENTEACVEQLLAADPVEAETLEEINADGFVSVVDELNPGTQYYLLAYASNGYESDLFISEGVYTTGDPLPVYMNFSMADLKENLLPASSEGYFGTYNYYARPSDDEWNLSALRKYIGQVTISDSPYSDLPADDYGIVTEYVTVKGVFGAAADYFGFDDTMTMECYGGVLYQLPAYYGPSTNGGYYFGVMYATKGGSLYGHDNQYIMLGGFVEDGYVAFVDATGSYGFNGWYLMAYQDEACSQKVGGVDYLADILLVDPAKDNNGLAPAPQTSSVQLKKISNTLAMGPTNYVETVRGNIHSIIDNARKTPALRGNLTSIKGQRDAKAVDFNATASDLKVKAATRYDNPTNSNISLR